MNPAGEPQQAAGVGDLVRDEAAGVDAVVTDIWRGRLKLRPMYGFSDWEPQDPRKVFVLKRRGSWER